MSVAVLVYVTISQLYSRAWSKVPYQRLYPIFLYISFKSYLKSPYTYIDIHHFFLFHYHSKCTFIVILRYLHANGVFDNILECLVLDITTTVQTAYTNSGKFIMYL